MRVDSRPSASEKSEAGDPIEDRGLQGRLVAARARKEMEPASDIRSVSRATARRSSKRALAAGVVALSSACTNASAPAENAAAVADERPAQLTNRVWVAPDASLPGAMLIFLSNGTLVQDSCWETYRLSQWRSERGQTLRWQEDTEEIVATIVTLGAADLTLRFDLRGGAQERSYVAAMVPYVCPDMPR